MLAMLSDVSGRYVTDCAGNPGEASGLLNEAADDEGRVFMKVPVGDMGSFKFKGVGPLGNSHCVDCVGK